MMSSIIIRTAWIFFNHLNQDYIECCVHFSRSVLYWFICSRKIDNHKSNKKPVNFKRSTNTSLTIAIVFSFQNIISHCLFYVIQNLMAPVAAQTFARLQRLWNMVMAMSIRAVLFLIARITIVFLHKVINLLTEGCYVGLRC